MHSPHPTGAPMMPLSELMEDRQFNLFFRRTPHLHNIQQDGRLCWRIWIQQVADGRWRKKDVADYQFGVRVILGRLESIHDAALQCRGRAYEPPVQRVKLVRAGRPLLDSAGRQQIKEVRWKIPAQLLQDYGLHHWCFYCRRPTVFGYFKNHHAFRGTSLEPFVGADRLRCTLCGIPVEHDRGSR